MTIQSVVKYLLLAVLIMVLGAFAGWYLFLRAQNTATASFNSSLGLGASAPFGVTPGTSAGVATSATDTPATGKPPQLWHIAQTPVAGFGFASTSAGEVIRFVDRANGYVYDANVATGAITRVTNTLFPKIYEAYVASENRIMERSLDASGSITTFDGLISTGTSTELTGAVLQADIEAVAPDQNSSKVFALRKNGQGVVGTISEWNGSRPNTVFTFGVPGWRAWWLQDGRIILVQKAADGVAGYAYTIKGATRSVLIDPQPGLVIAPQQKGGALLYSTSSGGSLALFARTADGTTMPISLTTIADKCTWSLASSTIAYCAVPQTMPSRDFMDDWYRGDVHSADTFWRVDTSMNSTDQVFVPDTGAHVDVTRPAVDESNTYLAFIDSQDLSLWVLRFDK